MSKVFAGLDPGHTGAIAFWDGDELVVHDMPTYKKNTWSEKRCLEVPKFRDIIKAQLAIAPISCLLLEESQSHPNDGVLGAFSNGESFGIIQGVLACFDVPVALTHPAIWKPQMNLTSSKTRSVEAAILKFPEHKKYFDKAKFHGRAEASLLAWLSFMKFGGSSTPWKPNDSKKG